MRGETSLLSARQSRTDFAARIAAAGSAAEESGKQLFSLCALLDDDPRLVALMTDTSRSKEDRRTLVTNMLAGTGATDLTVDVLKDLACRRWSKLRNVSDALEDIGVECVLAASDADGSTGEVATELAQIRSAVLNYPIVRNNLSDFAAKPSERVAFWNQLFGGTQMNPHAALLARHATEMLRRRRYVDNLGWMIDAISRHMGKAMVIVVSAVPLKSEQVERLAKAYAAKLGKPVHINEVVDPSVIGGIRIEVGSEVTDRTVAAQLKHLKHLMAAKKVA